MLRSVALRALWSICAVAPTYISACTTVANSTAKGSKTLDSASSDGTGDCGEVDEHGQARRVTLYYIPMLFVFWTALMVVVFLLYSQLRAGHRKEFEAQCASGKYANTVDGKGRVVTSAIENSVATSNEIAAENAVNSAPDELERTSDPPDFFSMEKIFGETFDYMDIPMDQVTRDMGLDASIYLTHLRDCGFFCLFLFGTMSIWLLLVYRFAGTENGGADLEKGDTPQLWSLYAFSYANMGTEGPLWISVVAAAYQLLCSCAFAVYRQKVMKQLKSRAGTRDFHSKKHMWLKQVPRQFREAEIRDWFDQKFPEQIDDVRVALDVHHLGRNIRERRKLILKINKVLTKLQNDGPQMSDNKEAKKIAKVDALKAKLEVLQKQEPELRKMQVRGSGSIVVAFKKESDAAAFRKAIWQKTLGSEELGCSNWKAAWAPLPAEIYWENLGLDNSERARSKALSLGLTYATFSFFLLWVAIAVYFIGKDYMHIVYGLDMVESYQRRVTAVQDAVTVYIFYPVICVALFVGILGMEEEMAPITKYFSKYERPSTKSKKQSSYMAKTYFFYVIYHLIITTVALGVLSFFFVDCDNKPMLFVETIGAFHMNRAFLTCAIIDPFHTFEGVKFFRRQARQLTVEERAAYAGAEDEEEDDEGRIDEEEDPYFSDAFDYTKNYGESLAIFTSMSYYCVMHPAITLCCMVYYWVKYSIDKYQITQQYTRPRIQYSRRARSTTKFLLFSAMTGQLGNVIFFGIIRPNGAVLGGFVACFFFSALFYLLYSNKRKTFYKWFMLKTDKPKSDAERESEATDVDSANRQVGANVPDGGSVSDDEPFDVEEFNIEIRYNPPNPDTMDVGINIMPEPGSARNSRSSSTELRGRDGWVEEDSPANTPNSAAGNPMERGAQQRTEADAWAAKSQAVGATAAAAASSPAEGAAVTAAAPAAASGSDIGEFNLVQATQNPVAVATFAMHSQDFDVGNTDFLEDELDDDGIGDGGQEFEFSTDVGSPPLKTDVSHESYEML